MTVAMACIAPQHAAAVFIAGFMPTMPLTILGERAAGVVGHRLADEHEEIARSRRRRAAGGTQGEGACSR